MATVIQLPKQRGFGEALGSGASQGFADELGRQREEKKQEMQRTKALKFMQTIATAPDRASALQAIAQAGTDVSFAMDAQDMIAAATLVDKFHPDPTKTGAKVTVKAYKLSDGQETLIQWDKGGTQSLQQQALAQGASVDVPSGAGDSETAKVLAGRGLLQQHAGGLLQDMGPRSKLSPEAQAQFDRQLKNLDPSANLARAVLLTEQIPFTAKRLEVLMGDRLGKEFVTAIKNKGKFVDVQNEAIRLMVRGDPITGNVLPFDAAIKQALKNFEDNEAIFNDIRERAKELKASDEQAAQPESLSDSISRFVNELPPDNKLRQFASMFGSGDPAQQQVAENLAQSEPTQDTLSVDGQTYVIPEFIDLSADDAERQLLVYLTTRYKLSERQAKQIIDREYRSAE